MYEVSDAYKAAIYTTPIYSKLSGVITLKDGRTIDIYDNSAGSNVVANSVSVNNKAVSKTKLEYGAAYVGELNISIYNDINRNLLYGAEITLSWFLKLANNTYEEIPLGVYIINEAIRTKRIIKITAYDKMQLFDAAFQSTETAGTIYEVLTYILNIAGGELAQTEEEIEALTNGSRYITVTENAGYQTYRDIISDIANIMCCFATMSRDGKLKFVPFSTAVTQEITAAQRNNSNIAEKIVNYDTLRTKVRKSVYTVVKTGQTVGTSLFEMAENTLIGQNHETDYVKTTLQNMVDAIAALSYTPASCNIVGNPALELGDMLKLTTGNAVECYMPIMSYEWKYHGDMKVKAEGADVTEGQSKSSKVAAGIADEIASKDTIIYTYENARDYEIGADFKQIIRINFVSTSATKGIFQAQVLVETDTDAEISVRYVFNNSTDLLFIPVQQAAAGKHIITLFYPLTAIPANTSNSIRVQMSVSAGSLTIQPLGIKAAISAQGLSAEAPEWDGTIEIEEQFTNVTLAGITIAPLAENVAAVTQIPAGATISEAFTAIQLSGITIAGFNEQVLIEQN